MLLARPYTDADLPQAQAAIARWVREAHWCGYCHTGDLVHRIYAGIAGRHPVGELVQVWEDADEIIGIAIAFRFECSFDLFVAPKYRAEYELTLLHAASEINRNLITRAGNGELSITDVYSCDTQRRQLLEHLGYAEYRVWDDITERSLAEPLPTPQIADGFIVRHATLADAAALAAVRNAGFNDSWTTEQYHDEVMLKPGYRPEYEIVAATPDGRVAALAVTWYDEINRVALFEPVATHPEFQRRGLARAVMLTAMQQMQQRGMERAIVAHNAENTAARALYHGLGFVVKHTTLGYRLE
jgi:ribosomal protein S18 acetylase RimI-like enzyme